MNANQVIDETIQTHLQHFRKHGALTVRPGYKTKNGWITPKEAIVVTVKKKNATVPVKDLIPTKIGNYLTDVREATGAS